MDEPTTAAEAAEPAAAPGWPCEAYGPEGLALGAWCFIADQHARTCGTPAECAGVMATERTVLFGRINELAAGGDEVAKYLAGEFSSPDELLGGPAADSPSAEDRPGQ